MERILVVDDESMIRQLACRILTEHGYRVMEASDGAEALDLVLRHGSAVDLVLSDIIMPRLTGLELLHRLSDTTPGLPVVLMSGYGTSDLSGRGITVPCALLAKPFGPAELLAEIRRCLRGQAATGQNGRTSP